MVTGRQISVGSTGGTTNLLVVTAGQHVQSPALLDLSIHLDERKQAQGASTVMQKRGGTREWCCESGSTVQATGSGNDVPM